MNQDSMDRAYRIADELIKDRLQDRAPELAEKISDIEEADILVVRGVHDHIHKVLGVAGTRFAMVDPRRISVTALRPDQVMFVNCGAKFDERGLNVLRSFVESGGFLFTTDWALRDVLEAAFPGYVEYNGVSTADTVVRVEIHQKDDPLLAMLIGPEDDPQWWVEGSSYPIRILRPEKVDVIISSKELERHWGEAPVFVTFEVGKGRIYHMISHFYLQRTETRTARHKNRSAQYLAEKKVSPAMAAKYQRMGSDDLSLGEMETAFTSRSMMAHVMHEKVEQMRRMRDEEKFHEGGGPGTT